ncbi:hypothetical protein SDC9_186217 [bioreactor metagenome]|uniref:Pyridoxamine 5'-phosphate oxidase N-terminal domain-containing protein n=1 Tax=bioreactor metagenome TaxID=1076179 RepID=A0A645HJY2_9ZZZZ
MNEVKKQAIRDLRQNCGVAYLASVSEDGYPQIKAVLVLEHQELKTQYFSTLLHSQKARQYLRNPQAAVYYCDERTYQGVQFTGRMEVCTDHDTKQLLWRDGFEIYYPHGVDDEDYCVLKFTAETVNYYHALDNETIAVKELSDGYNN